MTKTNINPMQSRCGAKTRSGGECSNFGMKNGRCRMHGGKSTGAPKGNQNALKHGLYSREAILQRKYTIYLLNKWSDFDAEGAIPE